MHLNNKNSKFLFNFLKKKKNISYAGQPLCGMVYKNQPANSMRDEPTRPTFCRPSGGQTYAGRASPHCHPYFIKIIMSSFECRVVS